MDEPFNPYVEWLGLTKSTVKPDHYRLLGLPPFESDARRIASACDGMLAKVRGNRPGSHVREWQSLLDELTAARNCLLDDATRANYDGQLRDGDDPAAPVALASSSSGNQSGGANYMWPPGFEPPAAVASSPPGTLSQPSHTVSATNSTPAASGANPGQTSYAPYAAPAAVPVLIATAAPTAAPVAKLEPATTESIPHGTANGNAPFAPVAQAWSQPGTQAPGYANANHANTNYTYPGVPNGGLPLASPIPSSPAALPLPPASPYGAQGADPMAPVASPLSSSGSLPLAQPIVGYGQLAPVAYPAGGYGQSHPQAQAVGMNYATPVAQAMPVGGMPVAGIPVAAPAGANAGQAMPVRAVAAASAEPDLGLRVASPSAAKAYKQSRKKNSVSVAIAALMAASLLVVAAFFVAMKDGGLLAKKPDVPRDAKELPIPKDVPPPVDPYAAPPTSEILAPLAEDDSKTNTKVNKPKRPKIGPLVEEGQTPETMPLIGPEMKKTDSAESVIVTTEINSPMKPADTTPVSTASPQETAAVRKALGKALVAMGYRDWDTSKDKLAEAKTLATDEFLKEKVEAVESVSTGAQEFWRAVRESTKSLGAGQELVIGNTRVAVVEANDKLLILRVGGTNKRYPIDDLPMGLARTLATTWFDNNAASTKVFTGAFLYVEPNGDPAEVRQLWQAAKQGGVNMDLLMPLLEDDLKAEAKEDADKS